MPLLINASIQIADDELEWRFIRSSGPGGQNVNKVASAVQLRFLMQNNTNLSATVKRRVERLAGQKLNDDGSVLIQSRSTRSQDQNRREALSRLQELIQAALIEPKIRKRTRPTRASKERRIDAKKRRGNTKQKRQGHDWD